MLMCVALSILILDRAAVALHWPAEGARAVVLLSSDRCPHSRAVRARLFELGVPFEEIDSRRNPISAALAGWAFHSLSVPVLVAGEEIIYGNRTHRIEAALAKLGYEVASRAAAIEVGARD